MAMRTIRAILGLYREPDAVANGVERLQRAGFGDEEFEVLTTTPYPEGAFGEAPTQHRLFVFPLVGAISGFSVGLLLTVGTQLAYPMVTGGKPILSIPPMFNVMYEGTMLGAILFTIIGIIFESRLPALTPVPYDPRITEGYIGLLVRAPADRIGAAEAVLKETGALDLIGDSRGGRAP